MGCLVVSANSIGVFSIPCILKLLLLSSQTFINWSVQNTFKFPLYSSRSRLILLRQISNGNFLKAPPGGGRGVLGSGFAGYVLLASQNSHPIIVYSVANYRPHLSHFWANVIVSLALAFLVNLIISVEDKIKYKV